MVSVPQQSWHPKSPAELAIMREAGKRLGRILEGLTAQVRPGMTTAEIDKIAERDIRKADSVPSFKGYYGYPASICISVNEQVVHGIPGKRVLKEGDLVSMDIGLIYKGWQADTALSLAIGKPRDELQRLIDTTQGSLYAGIAAMRLGNRMGDIGAAIQRYAEDRGYSVVREYVGHGIGRQMHEAPQVPNYGTPRDGIPLVEGMVLALEPMVNIGTYRTRVLSDRWTVVTADGSLSAHFEHTVAIVGGEPEVFTKRPGERIPDLKTFRGGVVSA